jgi:integrase
MARQSGDRGSVRWRGTSWEVIHTIGGKRHYSTYNGPEDDETGARKYANARYDTLTKDAKKKGAGIEPDMLMSRLCARFRQEELPDYTNSTTIAHYRTELGLVEEFFVQLNGDPEVREVSRSLASREYLKWRQKTLRRGHGHKKARSRKASKSTVRGSMAFLHLLFEFASEVDVIDVNPARASRRRNHGREGQYDNRRRPEIISSAQYTRLLREALKLADNPVGGGACHEPADMCYGYIVVVGELGLRNESEALWLEWSDLDFDGGFVRVADLEDLAAPSDETAAPKAQAKKTKGRQTRWVPMTSLARTSLLALKALHENNPWKSRWVFHFTNRGRRISPGDRIQSMAKRVKAAAKAAELPARWQMYDLRHRRITLWLADGQDTVKVMQVAGHKSLQTTMWYTHLLKEHLVELGDSTTVTPENLRELEKAWGAMA